MKKLLLITLVFIFKFGISQTKVKIDSLLNKIAETKNSKEITMTEEGQKLIKFGWKSLQIMAKYLTD